MEIEEFFRENGHAAIAFSGGVDSSYLLWAAKNAGADVRAYFVKTAFQPQFELDDAKKIAEETGTCLCVIDADPLKNETIAANPKDRCYYCKQMIFSEILSRAKADGYTAVLDGTNASDEVSDRPGMKALQEMNILSPLRICGLTKDEIRKRSKEAGLFTWNKPAYACLATRIPSGEPITEGKLRITENSEKFLSELGFTDFRIRQMNGAARIQIKEAQLPLLMEKRSRINKELKKYYSAVTLDLETR